MWEIPNKVHQKLPYLNTIIDVDYKYGHLYRPFLCHFVLLVSLICTYIFAALCPPAWLLLSALLSYNYNNQPTKATLTVPHSQSTLHLITHHQGF